MSLGGIDSTFDVLMRTFVDVDVPSSTVDGGDDEREKESDRLARLNVVPRRKKKRKLAKEGRVVSGWLASQSKRLLRTDM